MSRDFSDYSAGVSGMFREFLECFGSSWNGSVVSGMLREFLEYFVSFWHVSKVSGMFR